MRARLAAASAAVQQMEAAMAGRRAGVVGMPAAEARDMMVMGGFSLGLDGAQEDGRRQQQQQQQQQQQRGMFGPRAGLPVTPDEGERGAGAGAGRREGTAAAAEGTEAPARGAVGVRERRRMVAARAMEGSEVGSAPPGGPAGQAPTQVTAMRRARDERIFGPGTAPGR